MFCRHWWRRVLLPWWWPAGCHCSRRRRVVIVQEPPPLRCDGCGRDLRQLGRMMCYPANSDARGPDMYYTVCPLRPGQAEPSPCLRAAWASDEAWLDQHPHHARRKS